MSAQYVERQAGPAEETRGEVLDALAGGAYWVFLLTTIDGDGNLSLKLEVDDRMDADSLKAILQKTLEALP